MKNLYYEEEEGEFYWVKETPKTFMIEWVAKFNCDSEKTPIDQNVKYKELRVSKINKGKHCLKSYDEDGILIYPFQSGQPFFLRPATIDDINKEIADCEKWGVSSQYYKNLRIFTW